MLVQLVAHVLFVTPLTAPPSPTPQRGNRGRGSLPLPTGLL